MGRLIKYIQVVVSVVLCLNAFKVSSQINNFQLVQLKGVVPAEYVVVNTNNNLLLAGESLYYKLLCLAENNKPSFVSNFAYVNLVGKNNTCLFEHKLKLKNGLASSDFFIPSNIETGHYKLVAYTKWMQNNVSNPFFTKDVYIVNPFTLNSSLFSTGNKQSVLIKKTNKVLLNDGVSQKTELKSYSIRSKVSVDLKDEFTGIPHGNYTLSVRKIDSLEIFDVKPLKEGFTQSKTWYLPEIRGEIISGKVISKSDGAFVSNKIVTFTLPGKNYIFKNVKTNSEGAFYFNISEEYKATEAVIQLLDSDRNKYKVILDSKPFLNSELFSFYDINLDENVKPWLLKKSIYSQIESAYNNLKKDSIVHKVANQVFYGEPTVTYVLDDYKRFPTVRETFIEVVQEAAIRERNGSYVFKVYDFEEFKNNVFKDYDPLVLVDGYFVQNNTSLVEFDCSKIESVSLIRGIYFNGPAIYNGILDVKTKKIDFKLSENKEGYKAFKMNVPQESKVYYSPNYNKESDNLKRIPDYRTQLLWMPKVEINALTNKVEFYTSDVIGYFEMVLEGYTFNGDYVNTKKVLVVEN